ncbi:hypothetical protein BDV98DRAFT_593250 [Pterulicium gracile]|uniref:Uncharacterized protein n=1 Tax=Pterulicium gracile TaxID=1884261 RepID=A0A5C3QMB8_9AGAR|nr:hypothetical protein BDV98DRAFT_593250 [Pterula gracilis]
MKPISPSPSACSKAQIRLYLSVVRYQDDHAKNGQLPPPTLQTLHVLNHLHLVTFPFDSSAMHYTDAHTMPITPDGIFQWAVVDSRGGSYCFGLNTLLLKGLKGLGFLAYGGGGNFEPWIYPIQDLTPCGHMVVFVQISGAGVGEDADSVTGGERETWFVDVRFGGTGPVRPLRLSEDEGDVVMGNASTPWWRLERFFARADTVPEDAASWESTYAFSEAAYSVADYEHASECITTIPCSGRFWWNIVAVEYFTLEVLHHRKRAVPEEEIAVQHLGHRDVQYGRYTLNGEVFNKTVGAQSEVRVLVTEKERIGVLMEVFGVRYEDEERAEKCMTGRDAEIGSGFVLPLPLWQTVSGGE